MRVLLCGQICSFSNRTKSNKQLTGKIHTCSIPLLPPTSFSETFSSKRICHSILPACSRCHEIFHLISRLFFTPPHTSQISITFRAPSRQNEKYTSIFAFLAMSSKTGRSNFHRKTVDRGRH